MNKTMLKYLSLLLVCLFACMSLFACAESSAAPQESMLPGEDVMQAETNSVPPSTEPEVSASTKPSPSMEPEEPEGVPVIAMKPIGMGTGTWWKYIGPYAIKSFDEDIKIVAADQYSEIKALPIYSSSYPYWDGDAQFEATEDFMSQLKANAEEFLTYAGYGDAVAKGLTPNDYFYITKNIRRSCANLMTYSLMQWPPDLQQAFRGRILRILMRTKS